MKILLKIYFLLLLPLFCFAQEKQKTGTWQIESTFMAGKVVKHRDYFRPKITEPTFIYEVSIQKQTNKNSQWAGLYNYPLYGFSFSYIDIGNKNVLGQAVGVLPFLNFRKRNNYFNLNLKIGFGFAYFTKTFNEVTNYENNAIGGHFANYTRFEFGINKAISNKIDLNVNFGLTHSSNANTEQPNLGVNFMTGNLAITYKFLELTDKFEKQKLPYSKKIGTSIFTGLGFNSVGTTGGPNYPVWLGGFFVSRKHSLKGQITLGSNIEYYESVKRILVNMEHSESGELLSPFKVSALVGYGFLFPHFSFHIQAGPYLYNPHVQLGDVVVRLTATYHITNQYQPKKLNPFVAMALKSHYFSADNVSLMFGVNF